MPSEGTIFGSSEKWSFVTVTSVTAFINSKDQNVRNQCGANGIRTSIQPAHIRLPIYPLCRSHLCKIHDLLCRVQLKFFTSMRNTTLFTHTWRYKARTQQGRRHGLGTFISGLACTIDPVRRQCFLQACIPINCVPLRFSCFIMCFVGGCFLFF